MLATTFSSSKHAARRDAVEAAIALDHDDAVPVLGHGSCESHPRRPVADDRDVGFVRRLGQVAVRSFDPGPSRRDAEHGVADARAARDLGVRTCRAVERKLMHEALWQAEPVGDSGPESGGVAERGDTHAKQRNAANVEWRCWNGQDRELGRADGPRDHDPRANR